MILSIEVIKLQKTEIYICTNVRSRLDTSWWLSKYSKFSKIKLNWWNGWIINNSKFCLIDLWHWNSAKVHCIKSNTPTFTTNSIVKLANAWLFYTLVSSIHIDSWLESPPCETFLSFSTVLYNFLLESVVCMHSVTILLQNGVYDLLHLSSSIKI